MPDAAIMEQWAKALESGDYPQAKNTLSRLAPYAGEADPMMDNESKSVGFCCLGVLCDLAAKAGAVVAEEFGDPNTDANGRHVRYGEALSDSFLPKEVVDWAGLESNNPTVKHTVTDGINGADFDIYSPLADINDIHGKDFGYIAKAIRENYLAKPDAGSPT